MSASTSRQLRRPLAKVPQISSDIKLETPMPKIALRPLVKAKDLPPTPAESSEKLPVSRIREKLRASSVYSRPTGTWEAPAWWHFGEDDSNEQDIDFILPPTIYHAETQRQLESRSALPFDEPLTPRTFSPLIPEPSPSHENSPATPEAQSLDSYISSRLSIPEDYDREWAPLPPTPPSPPAFTYPVQLPPREDNSFPSPSQLDPTFGLPPSTIPPPASSPSPPPRLQTPHNVSFDPEDDGLDAYQAYQDPNLHHSPLETLEYELRGRSEQRKPPPECRDRDYLRVSDEQSQKTEAEFTLEDIAEDEPLKHVPRPAGDGRSIRERKDDSPQPIELLEQGRAKTLSEAYHKLLIEQYQDLAAEGRAWEALSDETASVPTDGEDGRDVKMIPQPLFFRQNSVRRPHDTYQHAQKNERSRSKSRRSKEKGKGIKMIIPSQLLKRHHSSTSGEIPISPPFDLEDEDHEKQKQTKKLWSKQPPPKPQHIPPLPLQLPQSMSTSHKPSFDERNKHSTSSTESSLASGSTRESPRDHTRSKTVPEESRHGASPESHVRSNTDISHHGASPLSHKTPDTEETYPQPMDRAPQMEIQRPVPRRAEVAPTPPHKQQVAFSDPQRPKTADGRKQSNTDSLASTRTSWSILQRTASLRSNRDSRDHKHGPSILLAKALGRNEKAREKAQEQRREELKRSIHLIGQVDPRSVETAEDTKRRLAFRTRKQSFGHGWS